MTTAALRLTATIGLATDAYVHTHLASRYDPVTASISQGTRFRVQAAIAVLVSRRRLAADFTFLVAARAPPRRTPRSTPTPTPTPTPRSTRWPPSPPATSAKGIRRA